MQWQSSLKLVGENSSLVRDNDFGKKLAEKVWLEVNRCRGQSFIVISETLCVAQWLKLSLSYILAVHVEGEGNTSTQISKLECDMLNVKLEDGNCELVSMKVCIVGIVAVPYMQ